MDLAKAVQAMEESPPIELILRGEAAVALVALLELALRHPDVGPDSLVAGVGRRLVEGLRAELPAAALTLCDPAAVVDVLPGEPA